MSQLAVKEAKFVWYADLEKLVASTYDQPYYNLLDGDGAEHSNGSVITCDVGPEGNKYGSIDDLTVEQWLAGEENEWGQSQPDVSEILDDLYKKGLVEPGYYVIHIWW